MNIKSTWHIAVLAAASWAMLGCATPESNQQPMHFTCDRGEDVSIEINSSHQTATLIRHGSRIDLPIKSADGATSIFSNGPNTIRLHDKHLTIEVGRMMPIHCHAK